jgi:hypothetical protein
MMFSREIVKVRGPTRIFIGGVHGKEGLTTINLIKQLKDDDVEDGKLLLYNCPDKPTIYVELHCYKPESYLKLIDLDRKKRVGVPPLIELAHGVLISSVAPYLRTKVFKRDDVCITLEMPCRPTKKSARIYLDVMKAIAGSNNRRELEDKLKINYPSQVKTAQRYAAEFFGEYPAF